MPGTLVSSLVALQHQKLLRFWTVCGLLWVFLLKIKMLQIPYLPAFIQNFASTTFVMPADGMPRKNDKGPPISIVLP